MREPEQRDPDNEYVRPARLLAYEYIPLPRIVLKRVEKPTAEAVPTVTEVPAPAPRAPLVRRCPGLAHPARPCGARIARNKTRCLACAKTGLQEIAASIDTPEALEEVLRGLSQEERENAMSMMREHLAFA